MCYLDASETDLLARLKAGEEGAYESLFRAHVRGMLAVARRFFSDSADAADAVQDAFVSAFRAMGRFEGSSRLGTWLHRITVNACLMKLRGRTRRLVGELSDAANLPGRSSDADSDREEVCWRVRAAVDRLPATYRTVVRLRDLDGLDTAQTAARLGTTPEVVKTRLHRARHALRALLEHERDRALCS